MKTLCSVVNNHTGECVPVWLNTCQFTNRMDNGVTGFFKRVKTHSFLGIKFKFRHGDEFHGIIRNGVVTDTL